jgi:hypothetical protein
MVFQAKSPNKRGKSIEEKKKEAQGNDRRESQ